jgi:hypothetical protein
MANKTKKIVQHTVRRRKRRKLTRNDVKKGTHAVIVSSRIIEMIEVLEGRVECDDSIKEVFVGRFPFVCVTEFNNAADLRGYSIY